MAKKIEWLDNFAENFAKDMKKTAGKIQKEDIIVDRDVVKGAKLGEVIKFQGRLYKVADLEFEDDKGPGVVLNEMGPDVPTSDPMSMAMGTQVTGINPNMGAQEYARTNPGDIYHYEVRDQVEQPAFEAAAAETAQEIEKERAFDRTTVDGHYTAPKNMGGATIETEIPAEIPTETPAENPVEDTPVDSTEAPIEEAPVEEKEEVVEEVPAEEVTEDVTEEVPAEDENKDDDKEEEIVEDDEEKLPSTARYNRILRRIMASK